MNDNRNDTSITLDQCFKEFATENENYNDMPPIMHAILLSSCTPRIPLHTLMERFSVTRNIDYISNTIVLFGQMDPNLTDLERCNVCFVRNTKDLEAICSARGLSRLIEEHSYDVSIHIIPIFAKISQLWCLEKGVGWQSVIKHESDSIPQREIKEIGSFVMYSDGSGLTAKLGQLVGEFGDVDSCKELDDRNVNSSFFGGRGDGSGLFYIELACNDATVRDSINWQGNF